MIVKWVSVDDQLPDKDVLVMARGNTHFGIALARFRGDGWEVQTFKEAWYKTADGILEWAYLDQDQTADTVDKVFEVVEKRLRHLVREEIKIFAHEQLARSIRNE